MATTAELLNALEGLEAVHEAMHAIFLQVGLGDTEDGTPVEGQSPGPFNDEQYMDALEGLEGLCDAGSVLIDAVMEPEEEEDESTLSVVGMASAGEQDHETAAVVTPLRGAGLGDWRL